MFKLVKEYLSKYGPRRSARYLRQHMTRGFSDVETWNIQHEFAKWAVPRLKRFKEINNGYPDGISPEEYDARIDEMIEGFEICASDLYWGFTTDDWEESKRIDKENFKKIDRAVELWQEHFHDLWW